jgi:glyoxylate/hydroxypyruvate reductase
MSEYIVMHCLLHMRQLPRLQQQQQKHLWHGFDQPAASAFTVGVLGLGVLGQDAAVKLRMMGFRVVGWSRSAKQIDGITCFSGVSGMDAFLDHTDILVCMLPATRETDGILDRELLNKLSRKGPFNAPVLINAGRGRQNNEDDILEALDNGGLHAATLDVFRKEPLPAESRFWSHPRVILSPHNAADSDPSTICRYVAEQIRRFERGDSLQNLVDPVRGY